MTIRNGQFSLSKKLQTKTRNKNLAFFDPQ